MPNTAAALYPHLAEAFSEESLNRRFSRPVLLQENVSYEFTRDPGLIHQYCLMRDNMFITTGSGVRATGQTDNYDDISDIMVARKGNFCVGGGRLTMSHRALPQQLPMERADLSLKDIFPQLKLSEHTYGEFSRLSILPEFNNDVVFPEMTRRFIKRAIAHGVEYAFNIAPHPLARGYRQTVQLFGMRWDMHTEITVPDREEYAGTPMVISVMDLTKFVREAKDTATAPRREELLAD